MGCVVAETVASCREPSVATRHSRGLAHGKFAGGARVPTRRRRLAPATSRVRGGSAVRRRGSCRRVLLVAVGLGAVGAIVGPAPSVFAACHAFTVEAKPSSVAEGAAVTVIVRRDAAVGPSQIDIETIDGTAVGGADYEAVARRTIAFSSETEQSFEVPTVDDAESEASETFRLHLSNPGGCTVNPNFVVGPDAEVTITDNDAPATSGVPPGPTSTSPPRSTTSTSATPAVSTSTTSTAPVDSATSTTLPTSTTSEAFTAAAAAAADDDDDGVPAAVVVVAILVALAAVGGVVWTWRRRTGVGSV